ncbi:MAG TPA: hypothetical protein PK264_24460 [Hyphomicrobiaceae bacterium]|nr:hypothetical protein [Hyphomicrobiaceae bacterium]
MSLETQIAALTQQAGLLLDLPQQIATTATAKIAEVTAAYNQRMATFTVTVTVDEVTGLDTQPGTDALPVRTMAKALSMVPVGGVGTIRLASDVTLTATIRIANKRVVIVSNSAVRRKLSFAKLPWIAGASTYRGVAAFGLADGASLHFNFVELMIPDGAGDAHIPHWFASPIGVSVTPGAGAPDVGFYDVAINLPATPYAAVIGVGFGSTLHRPTSLWVYAMTLPGAITSINGRLFHDITATAGTAAASLNWLTTNLTTV